MKLVLAIVQDKDADSLAKEFIQKYFEQYSEIQDYMNKNIAFGNDN